MAKQYKAGQLLTINSKVYRVKHYTNACCMCDAWNECIALCNDDVLCANAPADCCLQLVVPKSSLG